MTNRINQLEKDDLVVRVKNSNDRRSVLVQLTTKGQKIIDTALTDHVETQKRLVGGVPEAERAALNGLLQTYLTALEVDAAT